MISLHERLLPTSAGVEPATSWSPVERRIQLSHLGRPTATFEKCTVNVLQTRAPNEDANQHCSSIVICTAFTCFYFFLFVITKTCLFKYNENFTTTPPPPPQKKENFPIKHSDIFHVSAQNIDCGYSLEPLQRGGSNEYPQSMFLSRNKKNNVNPSFTI